MTTVSTTRDEVPPWVLTALAAAGQAIAVALIIAIGSADGPRPGVAPFVFAAGFGAVLLPGNRFPVIVLAAAVLGTFAYYAAGHPPIGMAVPVFGAFYTAAARGRVIVGVLAGVVLVAVSLYFRLQDGEDSPVLAYDVITNAGLIGCAMALALAVRSRHRLAEQQVAVVRAERRAEQERTAREVEAQRLAVARDLHDSIGHSLSLVSVQARVAREALGRDEEAARGALDSVVGTSSASLTDLRRALATLRSAPDGTGRERPDLSQVDRIAEAARDTGLDVRLERDADAALPDDIAATVVRIVQESVTNVLRHASARTVRITVGVGGRRVHVEVADDGKGDDGTDGGQGISGMRDRAELVGGTLSAGSGGEGFVVTATLPLEESA